VGAAALLALVFGAIGVFGVHRAWLRWSSGARVTSVMLAVVVAVSVSVAIQIVRAVA
jgi:hypothetical protein